MKSRRFVDRFPKVTVKLLIPASIIILLIVGAHTWYVLHTARLRNKAETEDQLQVLHDAYTERIEILERSAAALSLSLAEQPEIQRSFFRRDRSEMLNLLEPLFTTLKEEYSIVHLQFHDPNGFVFLRLHDPQTHGDYTFTYRRANALAIITRHTVSGVEVDPNRLGIHGVSPMFFQGEFIGLVEVGLDYDLNFLEDLKAKTGADYLMWISRKEADPAGLYPPPSAPRAPLPELFFYAGTTEVVHPISSDVYASVLSTGKPLKQFVTVREEARAVLIAPLFGFGDRIIGILETSISRTSALRDLRRDQRNSLILACIIMLGGMTFMWLFINATVLKPLAHLTSVARRQLNGDLGNRVELIPADEFGELGGTLNTLSQKLRETLRNQEQTIKERTSALEEAMADRLKTLEEKSRLSTAIEQAAEAISLISPEGRIVYVNPAYEAMTGFTSEEVVNREISEIANEMLSPELFHEIENTVDKGTIWTDRTKRKRKDGTTFDVELTVSSIRDPQQQVSGYAVVQRDISEQVHLETQLQQSQKMEAVGRLAGGVAHDFNNLLTTILGYVELMSKEPELSDTVREGIGEIKRSVEWASSLTQQLLAFSRKQILKPEILNLNHILDTLHNMLARLIGEHIRLEIDLTSDIRMIKADPGQIEQIIMNMAVNARDAMPKGGILKIETRNTRIDKNNDRNNPEAKAGDYVLLTVRDTGSGIEEKNLKNIFEPFFTTKKVGEGTGLGLSTVYGIVKQSGGCITVDSAPNHGTTFKIYLPASAEMQPKTLPGKSEAVGEPGGETLLLVEDEEALRKLTSKILEWSEYKVIVAANGVEALNKIQRDKIPRIDLLITDVIMPEMSGRDVADELQSRYPAMKVLFISGYTEDELVRHGVREETVHFLQKPFSPDSLIRKIKQVLG